MKEHANLSFVRAHTAKICSNIRHTKRRSGIADMQACNDAYSVDKESTVLSFARIVAILAFSLHRTTTARACACMLTHEKRKQFLMDACAIAQTGEGKYACTQSPHLSDDVHVYS